VHCAAFSSLAAPAASAIEPFAFYASLCIAGAATKEFIVQNVKVKIEGMSCGGCVRNVRTALEAVPGVVVKQVEVGAAEVAVDPAKASADSVKQAIEKRGFVVRDVE
jgi:copper chaperone